MKVIQVWLRVFVLFMVFLFSSVSLQAEGSWQMGLKDATRHHDHNQALFQWDSTYSDPANTGIEQEERPLYVDILNPGEIINIHLCGENNNNDLRIEFWPEDGSGSKPLKSIDLNSGNVGCTDSFDHTLSGGVEWTPPTTGTYQIRLDNRSGHEKYLKRFDVYVKSNYNDVVDPTENQGRLWGYRLAFNAYDYDDDHSTNADLYAVVDGGFVNSYYVWQLNLDHFAGYRYELTANNLGLVSPNPDGSIVAGLSGCIDSSETAPCPAPHGNRNHVDPLYKLYLSNPQTKYPRPLGQPVITNLKFLDDQGVDDSISPNGDHNQDTGNFTFTTNLATKGTYTITLDINGDGQIDAHDVFLSGLAVSGPNTINWDGKANDGTPVPNGSYRVQTELKIGEFHFTAADVETSGGSGNNGLTINAVLNGGVIDTSNNVYWNDSTYLDLSHAHSYNENGTYKYHNWGDFSGDSDGNRAYIDTYTVGKTSAEVFVRLAIEPTDAPRKKIEGDVFEDLNSNGVRDLNEPGFPNITVALTEQGSGKTFYVSTDINGSYYAYTGASESEIMVDVNESMLPPEYVQTAGTDPETVQIPIDAPKVNNVGSDGYAHGVPAMTIHKTADHTRNVVAGQTVTYTYVVTNTGNVDIDAVNVTDVHEGAGTLSAITPASVATLTPGDTATFTSTYEVTQADVDAGTAIVNTATAQGTPKIGKLNPPQDGLQITPISGKPALDINKTADKTSGLVAGEIVTYTYVVTNTGNVDIDTVTVSDVHSGTGAAPVPGSEVLTNTSGHSSDLTANDGIVDTLAPHDVVTFTATYKVTQDDVDVGAAIINTATAHGTPKIGKLKDPTDQATVTPVSGIPAMTIVKTADKTSGLKVGDMVTYRYVVSNTGNVEIDDVNVNDVHSGTGTLTPITPANIATLLPGSQTTFTATYVVTQADINAGTAIVNTATAHGTPKIGKLKDPTSKEIVDTEKPDPKLDIDKTADKTINVPEGETVTYTYVVTNTGNVDIDDVNVTDVHSGIGALSAITPTSVDLAPGASQVFISTYKVTQADIDAETVIENTATAHGTPPPGVDPLIPPTDKEIVHPEKPAPVLDIDKTADKTSSVAAGETVTYTYPPTAQETVAPTQGAPAMSIEKSANKKTNLKAGETVAYTYVVTNTGNVDIDNVTVADVHSGTGTAPVPGDENLTNTLLDMVHQGLENLSLQKQKKLFTQRQAFLH